MKIMKTMETKAARIILENRTVRYILHILHILSVTMYRVLK